MSIYHEMEVDDNRIFFIIATSNFTTVTGTKITSNNGKYSKTVTVTDEQEQEHSTRTLNIMQIPPSQDLTVLLSYQLMDNSCASKFKNEMRMISHLMPFQNTVRIQQSLR